MKPNVRFDYKVFYHAPDKMYVARLSCLNQDQEICMFELYGDTLDILCPKIREAMLEYGMQLEV